MQNQNGNVCIRCGKPRIEGKIWKEQTRGASITHTAFLCPDKACQDLVDKQFAVQKEKRETIEKGRLQRAQASKLARHLPTG